MTVRLAVLFPDTYTLGICERKYNVNTGQYPPPFVIWACYPSYYKLLISKTTPAAMVSPPRRIKILPISLLFVNVSRGIPRATVE